MCYITNYSQAVSFWRLALLDPDSMKEERKRFSWYGRRSRGGSPMFTNGRVVRGFARRTDDVVPWNRPAPQANDGVFLRDEEGEILLRRQVSTRWKKTGEFFTQLSEDTKMQGGGFVVILEICGFHHWLVELLGKNGECREVIVIQPQQRSKRKTDRRDANALSELLWVNRHRLLANQRVQGVRRVSLPTADEEQDRQLTAERVSLGRKRTKTINQIRDILRRHNLEWDRPTKTFQTKKVRGWLKQLSLHEVERLIMHQLLEQWQIWDQQIEAVEDLIRKRFEQCENAKLLATIVGVSPYMALTIASRIGSIERFPRGRSLSNFFGLTPGSRSSGDQERLGSITKEGSRLVRFMLGQLVLHMLRRDGKMRAWYKRIKHRRGSKIARVAVMRRIAVIMWHMLSKGEAYRYGGRPEAERPMAEDPSNACESADRQAVMTAYLEAAKPTASAVAKGAPTTKDAPTAQNTGSSSLCSR